MNLPELSELLYSDSKSRLLREISIRYLFAAQYWWDNNGAIPIHLISGKLILNNDKLTRLIRDQIAEKSGVAIPDETPEVEINRTKTELDKLYPRRVSSDPGFSLEMFYYLAHPENRNENFYTPCSNQTFKN